MHRQIDVATSARPQRLFDVISDLSTYPDWIDLVSEAQPAVAHEADGGPAWVVTIGAQIGPFRRSKRLRMVRVTADAPHEVRFERRETDGRQHANWTMQGRIAPGAAGADLTLALRYDGRFWTGALDRVLGDMIDRTVQKLPAYVDG